MTKVNVKHLDIHTARGAETVCRTRRVTCLLLSDNKYISSVHVLQTPQTNISNLATQGTLGLSETKDILSARDAAELQQTYSL